MRISTSMAFELGVNSMNRQQTDLLRTQQQLSTGLRVVTASDDPAAAARAVELTSGAARNSQFMANQTAAGNSLSLLESTLGQFVDAHAQIRALLIQAGNATNSDQNRASIAADLRSQGEYLLSLANTRDANGAYLFSGYQEGVQAFQLTSNGVVFQGDHGQRELQVSDGRMLPISASGAAIFDRVPTGNGVFETTGATANTGSGVIDNGQVADAGLINGHGYRLAFHVVGGVATYDVIDTTLGIAVSSANGFSAGASVSVAGMQIQITGTPADGDQFTLAPSTAKSVFNTITEVVTLLKTPANSEAARARLLMGAARAVAGLDRSLEAASYAQAGAGSGLRELDALKSLADGRDLLFQKELSDLRDVDYARAISDLTRQQILSEATQKVFAKVMGRSLFDLI